MAGEALNNDYPNLDKNDMFICAQSVAEWTYYIGVDIIHAGIHN